MALPLQHFAMVATAASRERPVVTSPSASRAPAIYPKAEWKHQFEPANTRGEDFRLTNGSTIEVAITNIARELAYTKG